MSCAITVRMVERLVTVMVPARAEQARRRIADESNGRIFIGSRAGLKAAALKILITHYQYLATPILVFDLPIGIQRQIGKLAVPGFKRGRTPRGAAALSPSPS